MSAATNMMSDAVPGWRKYLFNSTWRYLLRILFALSGCAAIPWWLHQIEWTIPLTLGVVAAALADLDDRLAGRLVGEEAVQLHGGIGVTEEYAVGHLLARLTAIEHTFGDTRHHLATLAVRLDDHDVVAVI